MKKTIQLICIFAVSIIIIFFAYFYGKKQGALIENEYWLQSMKIQGISLNKTLQSISQNKDLSPKLLKKIKNINSITSNHIADADLRITAEVMYYALLTDYDFLPKRFRNAKNIIDSDSVSRIYNSVKNETSKYNSKPLSYSRILE